MLNFTPKIRTITKRRSYEMLSMLPKEKASPVPALFDKQICGNIEKEHGYRIVEKSKDINRMYSVGCTAHKEESKRWNLE